MRVIRLIQGISWMIAASSISPDNCNIEFNALRLANGMYLITPTITSNVYVLNIVLCLSENRMKKAAPTAILGIKYGRNAILFT